MDRFGEKGKKIYDYLDPFLRGYSASPAALSSQILYEKNNEIKTSLGDFLLKFHEDELPYTRILYDVLDKNMGEEQLFLNDKFENFAIKNTYNLIHQVLSELQKIKEESFDLKTDTAPYKKKTFIFVMILVAVLIIIAVIILFLIPINKDGKKMYIYEYILNR